MTNKDKKYTQIKFKSLTVGTENNLYNFLNKINKTFYFYELVENFE